MPPKTAALRPSDQVDTAEPAPIRPSPPRRAAPRDNQPDRRANILLAAEKLFGMRGYHAVSIRDIATEAGVPLALVGYYFGAKHELFHAIFENWQPAIAGRLETLAEVRQEADPARRLERIVDAFVSPLIALHQRPEGSAYARMAARNLSAPTEESERSNREFFDPLAHAFIDALMSTAPGATRGQVAWCYQFMLGALLHHLTDQRVERLSQGENRPADPAAKAHLLGFLLGGFRAVLNLPGPDTPTR